MTLSERLRHELREIGLVTAFFLAWFLFFLSLKKLILSEYQIGVTILGTAVIGALVVAKVVVILDKTPMARRFRTSWPALHVLWRSVSYTLVVFLVTLLERLVHAWRATGGFTEAVRELWHGRDVHHALAMTLAVGLAFVVFNGAMLVDRRLGEGGLRRLFFSRPDPAGAG